MPFRRRNPTKRRPRTRRPLRRRAPFRRPARTIPRARVYPFRRSTQHVLSLGAPDNGWVATIDNSVVKTFTFSLAELDNYHEFTSLFSMYKLNYAMVKLFPNLTGSITASNAGGGGTYIVTIWPATNGQAIGATFTKEDLNQIQRKRRFMLPATRATTLKMPLKQLGLVYGTTIVPPSTVDYTVMTPKYVATTEPNTVHYGMHIHITPTDGSAPANTWTNYLTVMQDVYLTCKQVE